MNKIEQFIKDGFIRHKHNCSMGEFNLIIEPDSKGCDCGLSKALTLLAKSCEKKELEDTVVGHALAYCHKLEYLGNNIEDEHIRKLVKATKKLRAFCGKESKCP